MSSRIFKICSFLFILIILSSCGEPNQYKQNVTPLSPRMIKLVQSGDGILTATAEVFDNSKKSLGRQDLLIDLQQGLASSPDGSGIKLKKGNHYSGLVIFSYQTGGIQLPIGFVVITEYAAEDFTNFSWTANDIILSNAGAQDNSSLSSSFVPETMIPNLDNDGDDFSNFAEFLDKSNPSDPNSIPQGPELVSTLDLEKIYQDEIVFSVKFKDNSGVASVKAFNPICGYSSFVVSPVTAGDNSEVELKASFNLHASNATSPINLTLKATDIWGASSEQTLTFQFNKDPNSPIHGPEIAIIKPSEGESISGETFAEAVACHEAEIISLEPSVGNLGDEDAKPESYQGKIGTAALGDGAKTLTFKAVAKNPQDPNQTYTQERSVNVLVDNNNPIRVESPLPGATIRDVATFIFNVDEAKLPNVTELYVESVTSNGEEDPIFAPLKNGDDNSAPETYKKSVDMTSVNDEREITINLKATSLSQVVTRKVTYRIDNLPKVSLKLQNSDGDFNPCLTPGKATLIWEVSNRNNDDAIYLNDQPLKDENNQWMQTGTKEIDCAVANYTLKTIRTGVDLQGNAKEFIATQDLNLMPIIPRTFSYKSDSPGLISGINILPPAQLNPFTLELSNIPDDQFFEIEWKKNGQDQPINDTGYFGNLAISASYELKITIFNKSNEILTQSLPISFKIAPGLVGWWSFDVLNDLGKDSSGFDNNGFVQELEWLVALPPEEPAISFSGNNSFINIPNSPSLNVNDITIMAWVVGKNLVPLNFQILGKSSSYLLRGTSGKLGFYVNNDQNVNYGLESTQKITVGTWSHVVAVYNSQSKFMKIYINGAEVGNLIVSGTLKKFTDPVIMGKLGEGNLDEVQIYNQPLSAETIKLACKASRYGSKKCVD